MPGIFKTYIYKGEAPFDAIVRAGNDARLNGFSGYDILCSLCDESIARHNDDLCFIKQKEKERNNVKTPD